MNASRFQTKLEIRGRKGLLLSLPRRVWLFLVIGWGLPVWAAAEAGSTGPPTVIHLGSGAGAVPSIRVDESLTITPEMLRAAGGRRQFGSIAFSEASDAAGLWIAPGGGAVGVTVEGFPGWSVLVPAGCRLQVRILPEAGRFQLEGVGENGEPVRVECSDGGRVTMAGGSRVWVEVLADRSYLVRGTGRVTGVTAEGGERWLGTHSPPLWGGPLELVHEAGAAPHYRRRLPMVEVELAGTARDGGVMQVGERRIVMAADGEHRVECANGAELRIAWNRGTGECEWRAVRGAFRFAVAGIKGGTVLGLSGQSGGLLWDTGAMALDCRNGSPDQSVLATLAGQSHLEIPPLATFQLKQVGAGLLTAAVAGGRATLTRPGVEQRIEVGDANLLLRTGHPVRPPRDGLAPHPVFLEWAEAKLMEVRAPFAREQVGPGQRATLTSAEGSQLQVDWHGGGEVVFQALAGDYVLHARGRGELAFGVRQGNGLALVARAELRALAARALPNNASPIELIVTGQVSALHAAESLTVLGASLFALHTDSPEAVYTGELTGFARPASVIEATSPLVLLPEADVSIGRFQNELYDDRIQQPPATVIR